MISFLAKSTLVWLLFVASNAQEKKRKITEQPFDNQHGVLLGPIGLGNPTQFTNMNLDTTIPGFFLIDSNCKTPGCRTNRKGFNTKASSSFHELLRVPYSTQYSAAKQKGRMVTDCLTAIGIGRPPRIPFPLIDATSGNLTLGYEDGVLGLGFQPKSSLIKITFFDILTLILDEPLVTWHTDSYTYTTTAGIHNSGLGTYGGNDLKSCSDNYYRYKTTKSDQWTLNLSDMKIGNTQLDSGEVLIRPGPQRFYGPRSEVLKIAQAVGAQFNSQLKEYVVDCNQLDNLPHFTLKINGGRNDHVLTSKDFIVRAQDQPQVCILLFAPVQPNIGNSKWVFGDAVMRNHCLQLNVRKKTISFAEPKIPSQS